MPIRRVDRSLLVKIAKLLWDVDGLETCTALTDLLMTEGK